jgi:hypothetical protein
LLYIPTPDGVVWTTPEILPEGDPRTKPVSRVQLQEGEMRARVMSKTIGALSVSAVLLALLALGQTTPPGAPPTTKTKEPTSATPQMIEEAIQRSQARAAKARASGAPEKWGSEEPLPTFPVKLIEAICPLDTLTAQPGATIPLRRI